MSPQFASALAAKWYPHRKWFLAVALVAFVLLGAIFVLGHSALASQRAFAALGPFVFVPWSLLCLCSWFSPAGRLQAFPGSLRWFASLSLSAFFALSLVWPAFVLWA
jgi:hypothetical protein